MTLKANEDYFEVEVPPYEQYRCMLKQEQFQRCSESLKSMLQIIPDPSFPERRRLLVKKIFDLGRKLFQSQKTVHLAVKLMDRVFSSCYDFELGCSLIRASSLELIGSGCLMLASKFEELD